MPDQQQIPFFVPGDVLRSVGVRAISMIRDRTLAGLDAGGTTFRAYSTEPFARPLHGITQRARRALGDRLHVFTTKKGKLWAVIEGGYAAFKAAAYPDDAGTVNLTATGAMLRALAIVAVDENTATVTLGFTRTDEALKALYHEELGAGPRRAIRHFLGLTDAEQIDLAQLAASGVTIRT